MIPRHVPAVFLASLLALSPLSLAKTIHAPTDQATIQGWH
jgi:hypothetical protein